MSEEPLNEKKLGDCTYDELVEIARKGIIEQNGDSDWRNTGVVFEFEDKHGFTHSWEFKLDSDVIDRSVEPGESTNASE